MALGADAPVRKSAPAKPSTSKPTAAKPAPEFDKIATAANQARNAGKLDEAANLYRRALAMRAQWPEGLWSLGAIYYEQEKFSDARETLARFLRLNDKAGPGWALLGLSEYQLEHYEPALADLQRAMTLGLGENEQMSRVVRFHLVLLETKTGEFEYAFPWLSQLAREGVTSPELIQAAGLIALRKPILPRDIEPADREVVTTVGRTWFLVAQRKVAEAEKEFATLLQQYPDTPNLHFSYASFQTVNAPEKAIGSFEQELKVQPGHVPTLVALTFEYLKRGEQAKALVFGKKAAEAGPADFAARAAYGRALNEAGDADSAAKELEAAKQLAPDSPQVRFALAAAYKKMGRSADAQREQAEFLRLKKLMDNSGGQ